MHRIKQKIISAVAALSLMITAVPVIPAYAEGLSTSVQEPFYSSVSFTPPGGTSTTSNSYRIPAMVTLKNGTIVAASDIRWNTTFDGGGLDTLTARSADGGVSWNYTVANYLGDNGNEYNGMSTCFIDPSLLVAQDDQTVYMLVDLYPYGVALNGEKDTTPDTKVGFDRNGNLLLSADNHKSYGYYLNLQDYTIYDSNGNSTGITVDEHFNYSYTANTRIATMRMSKHTGANPGVSEKTIAPTEETVAPTEETVASTEETVAPTEETVAPTEETVAPTEETVAPTEETVAPTEETVADVLADSVLGLLDVLTTTASAAEVESDAYTDPGTTFAGTTSATNLFYEDSPYKVVRTGYLYLTKSTDGGATWSAPKLLNLKNASEMVCLVGPGRGITTANGTMVFPVYSYNGSEASQKMGFLYSSDGENWNRIDSNFSIWSSESAVIELDNGALRFFFRNGRSQLCYADYTFGSGWSSVQYTGIATNSNTQISAITYSQESNGNQVILVSCPASSNAAGSNQSGASYRTNGRIFVFTDDGSTMTLANTIQVNTGNFMYSCLTERSDGSVAILYEDTETAWGTGDNCRYEMEMQAYPASELGVTFGSSGGENEGDNDEDPTESQTIVLTVGETKQAESITAGSAGTPGTYTTADGVAQYVVAHAANTTHQDSTANLGTNAAYTGDTVNLHQALYTFTGDNDNGFIIQNGTVYLGIDNGNSAGYPGSSQSQKLVFLSSEYTVFGSNAFNIKDAASDRFLYFWRDGKNRFDKQGSAAWQTAFLIYAPVGANNTSSTELPGYYQITAANQIQSGGKYLIAAKYNNSYYILYPSTSTTDYYAHVAKATGEETTCAEQTTGTTVTFTGLKPGQTTVNIGTTTYTVTVNALEKIIAKYMSPNAFMTLDAKTDIGLTGDAYTVSYEVTSGTAVNIDDSGNVSASSTDGTATITATVMKNGTVCGTITYEVTVNEVTVTDSKNIYVPVGGTASVSGLTGDIYTGMLDQTLATVVPESGNVNNGTITITGQKTGQTAVVVGTVKFNIFVVNAATRTATKYLYISVETMEHCDVYYTINGTGVYPVEGTGVLVEQTYNGGFHLMFFAAPHDGYALIEMSAEQQTNNGNWSSMNDFYALANGEQNADGTLKYPDGSDSDAFPFANADTGDDINCIGIAANSTLWKSGHGFRWSLIEGNLTISQMRNAFRTALELGCNGATNITKNGTDTFRAKFTFRAEKLPTFSKEIIGYRRSGTPSADDEANGKLTIPGYTDYFIFDEDVSLEFGDTLLYKFIVTSTSSHVNYTNLSLQDTKIGYIQSVADDTYNTPGTYTYYADYTINRDDVDLYTGGKFVNNAELRYRYSSQYSTGVYGGNASDEATCDIIGVVSYAWEEGTPEAIVRNEGDIYTLPSSFSLVVGDKFQISQYTGSKIYTEKVDGIDVTWTYSEEWGVQRYGSNEKSWFLVNAALNTDFTLAQSRSITFYGRWLANYSVVYNWVGEHPDVSPPEIKSYQSGTAYTVDNTFEVGETFNDGTYTWTFQGWKLGDSDEIYNGTTQTLGSAHVTYTGAWTKVANATSMTIYKTGCDPIDDNQSFLFHVSGKDLELDVVIHGNGYVTIDGLTVGETYTITEDTSWSWRYTPAQTQQSIKIVSIGNTVTFANTRSKNKWLNGGAWCDNRFNKTT